MQVHASTITLDTRREALEMWKKARGPEATYINLIGVFERAGYQDYADAVRKLFEAAS